MGKSVKLLFNGQIYQCQPDETVLGALLRQKVSVPYSCMKQTCLSCMMRSLNGTPPILSQRNLKETLQLQNNFLACACHPVRDMEIVLNQDIINTQVIAKVIEKRPLNHNVTEFVLQCESPLEFYGGQSVLLLNGRHIGKKFSIASPSSAKGNGRIEIHVDRLGDGVLSKWLYENLAIDDNLSLCNVRGEMHYLSGNPTQSLLLTAWGSSLAAMIGLVLDAFENNHTGAVYLFHGVTNSEHLYFQAELNEISDYFPNFHYIPCVEEGSAPKNGQQGQVDKIIAKILPDLTAWKVFLCGNGTETHSVQRYAYLAGAAMKDIYLEVTSIQ